MVTVDTPTAHPVRRTALLLSSIPVRVQLAAGLVVALSKGGTVGMPRCEMFWGDDFGSLRDKFGVQWMVNCTSKA